MDNKKKFTPNNTQRDNDLKEIKELLKQIAENLNVMKDILETRKRVHPSSQEIFGE